MLTIDTIKFSLSYPSGPLNNIDYKERLYKGYSIIPNGKYHKVYIYSSKFLENEKREKEKWFLKFSISKERNEHELYKDNIYIDIHLNSFIYNTFNDYYVNQSDIFKELYSLINEVLKIDFDDIRITMKEIHVSKDITLIHPVNHYLEVLKFLSFSYYYPYRSIGNNTITIHKLKDTKNLNFNSPKAEKIAVIYNKRRKFEFDDANIEDYHLLRFEYIFKDKQRRDIGIKQNAFPLSDIFKLDWDKHFVKYFLSKYLDQTTFNKYPSYSSLFGRQDQSQEEKYTEYRNPVETIFSNKKVAKFWKVESDPRRKLNRFFEVNFKKYLKKEFPEINSTGYVIFKEILDKAYDLETFGEEIPNIYKIYHRSD